MKVFIVQRGRGHPWRGSRGGINGWPSGVLRHFVEKLGRKVQIFRPKTISNYGFTRPTNFVVTGKKYLI